MANSTRALAAASIVLAASLAAPISAAADFQPTTYSIVALGTLPHGASGDDCSPDGLNNRGDVVGQIGGQAGPPTGQAHAFLWHAGTLTDLGGLPGFAGSVAWSINDHGVVAGNSQNAPFLNEQESWILKDGRFTPLSGAFFPSSGGLNSKGVVAGLNESTSQPPQAAIWVQGSPELLPPAGYQGSADGLNDIGTTVGEVQVDVPVGLGSVVVSHAVLWRNGAVTDLGRLGSPSRLFNGEGAGALAVNNWNWVVGWSTTEARFGHAFLWIRGRMHDLGTLPGFTESMARGINDSGDAVGNASVYVPSLGFVYRAVLWHGGRAIDLNRLKPSTFAGTLTGAKAINDRGQIIGNYTNPSNGDQRSCFLMTPVKGSV